MSTGSALTTPEVAGEGFANLARRRRGFRRFLRDRSAVVGMAVVVLFVFGAITAPWLAPHPPNATDFANRFAPPSMDHFLGTDHVGRDEFSRILHGARLSLGMAITATAGITVLGILLGMIAGMYGRLADSVIMRIVEVLQSLPLLILALVVVGLLGQGLRNLILTIAAIGWTGYARIVRGMTFKLRDQEYVQAAQAVGASRLRIILRHIAPNLVGPVVVLSTLNMGSVLLAVSGLSFLGFGVAPPTAEWGAMVSEARAYLDKAPMLLAWPGLAITLMVLAFNLAGDGLRDFLDPRTAEDSPGWERRRRTRRGRRPATTPARGAATDLPIEDELPAPR
ncbi:MAG: ABC transporter permease [Acidimicrobiales bacterium]